MRLDKFLSETGTATRTEAAKAARKGGVTVNGIPCAKVSMHIDPFADTVAYLGRKIEYKKFRYILLNKPAGYVSATEDGRDPTVLDLLPAEYAPFDLFPCGRLDKNTLGLMLITDDGALAHRLLSPKHHVEKTYRYRLKFPLSEADAERVEAGVTFDDGYLTKPAKITRYEETSCGEISVTEGKYHQIKRMFEAVGNKVTELERIKFGPLTLPENMARGEWRELTDDEINAIRECT